MFTECVHRRFLRCVLLAAGVVSVPAVAQEWQADWQLDRQMSVPEAPVWRPIIAPYGDEQFGGRRGPSTWPLYKQQPPGSQGDFRGASPESAVPPPGGAGSSGPDIPAVNGGGSGGPSAAAPDSPAPQHPTIPTPDIVPGEVDIPMDPLSLPPIDPDLI